MIRYRSPKQLTLAEFDWPFQTALDENNRWVRLSECIPWDELAEAYYEALSETRGRPSKDARLVIGAVIIKPKLCLSDRETVAQVQENPYLQYFVGLPGYQMEQPFAPSLLVEVRKRMGPAVFERFHGAIIEALEGKKQGRSGAGGGGGPGHGIEAPSFSTSASPEAEPTRKGKLILDATVAPQAIRYPTDLSLLNEAREFSERGIDELYHHSDLKKKPRTYRCKARTEYLAIAKQKRVSAKVRRRGVKSSCNTCGATWGTSNGSWSNGRRGRRCPCRVGYFTGTG